MQWWVASGTFLKGHPQHRIKWIVKCGRARWLVRRIWSFSDMRLQGYHRNNWHCCSQRLSSGFGLQSWRSNSFLSELWHIKWWPGWHPRLPHHFIFTKWQIGSQGWTEKCVANSSVVAGKKASWDLFRVLLVFCHVFIGTVWTLRLFPDIGFHGATIFFIVFGTLGYIYIIEYVYDLQYGKLDRSWPVVSRRLNSWSGLGWLHKNWILFLTKPSPNWGLGENGVWEIDVKCCIRWRLFTRSWCGLSSPSSVRQPTRIRRRNQQYIMPLESVVRKDGQISSSWHNWVHIRPAQGIWRWGSMFWCNNPH